MRNRSVVLVRTIVVVSLSFTALLVNGCVIGYPAAEYQSAEVMPQEESSVTIGYAGLRYRTAVTAQDEIGVSAWSLNFPFYLFKPKYYDIGLQMNYKHRFTSGRSRHALAFIASGSVYKAFVSEFVLGGDDGAATRYRYLGFSATSGLLYSYRFGTWIDEDDLPFVRLPEWLMSAHTIYGGVKGGMMSGGISVQRTAGLAGTEEQQQDLFILPFGGIAGGTGEWTAFIEVHPLVLMNTWERRYRRITTITTGISYGF